MNPRSIGFEAHGVADTLAMVKQTTKAHKNMWDPF